MYTKRARRELNRVRPQNGANKETLSENAENRGKTRLSAPCKLIAVRRSAERDVATVAPRFPTRSFKRFRALLFMHIFTLISLLYGFLSKMDQTSKKSTKK